MNRIILIGNGFDLAHGLETSYKSFIEDLWKRKLKKLRYIISHEDPDFYVDINNIDNFEVFVKSFNDLMKFEKDIKIKKENLVYFKNIFLKTISLESQKNWVDIENEYFKFLISKIDEPLLVNILNKEFGRVKEYLNTYLSELIVKNPPGFIEKVFKNITQEFDFNDFTEEGIDALIEHIKIFLIEFLKEDFYNSNYVNNQKFYYLLRNTCEEKENIFTLSEEKLNKYFREMHKKR